MDLLWHKNYPWSTIIIVAQKSKRAGRPKLPKGEAKTKILRVRVTPDERKEIEAVAKAAGKVPSEWLRDLIVSFINDPNAEALVRKWAAEYGLNRERRKST